MRVHFFPGFETTATSTRFLLEALRHVKVHLVIGASFTSCARGLKLSSCTRTVFLVNVPFEEPLLVTIVNLRTEFYMRVPSFPGVPYTL